MLAADAGVGPEDGDRFIRRAALSQQDRQPGNRVQVTTVSMGLHHRDGPLRPAPPGQQVSEPISRIHTALVAAGPHLILSPPLDQKVSQLPQGPSRRP